MSKFFEYVSAKCRSLSAKREIEVAEAQVAEAQAKLEEKRAKLGMTSKTVGKVDTEKVKDFYVIHFDELTFDFSRFPKHDLTELTSFMKHNNYDEVLCAITENLIIDVHAEKLNVTETVKAFLRRVSKKNAKELTEKESSFLINHLSVLYAIKHKVKHTTDKHDFSAKKKDLSLMQYAKYRRNCINDIYV